eukprot:gnl/TRDRNA2_/TRDRNA2_82790_c1_seq1.p1 gnl/TRDRNA2_/TRDRNA2_82790_c1~~gnl/TRDRNA2_/TRDRNA2_82790_c1_seq1.p1  ORF type:complete len:153 (-),score=31.51 gnl/TRDRNA2_/TRDRNA2_82790_c1_seq1:182-640(-)
MPEEAMLEMGSTAEGGDLVVQSLMEEFKTGDRVVVTQSRQSLLKHEESYRAGERGVVVKAPDNSSVLTVRLDGEYYIVENVLPLRKRSVPHRFVHCSALHLSILKTGHRTSAEVPSRSTKGSQSKKAGGSALGTTLSNRLERLADSEPAQEE